MLAVAFDTLKLARKLESAGFSAKQAQDASAAISDSFSEWQTSVSMATQADLHKLDASLKADIQRLEVTLKADVQKLESVLKMDLQKIEVEIRRVENTQRGDLQTKLAETKADIIKWVIGTGFAQAALILAVLKFH
jgi:hypothetical protein